MIVLKQWVVVAKVELPCEARFLVGNEHRKDQKKAH